MTNFGVEDLAMLLAATRVCKRLIQSMDIKQVRRQKLDKLVDVLKGVRRKARDVRDAVADAEAHGVQGGVTVLAFEPQEWWAIWHALSCMDQVLQPEHEYVSGMKPDTFRKRRKALSSLLVRVHTVLHNPAMPCRCTCQDLAKKQPTNPTEAYRWN